MPLQDPEARVCRATMERQPVSMGALRQLSRPMSLLLPFEISQEAPRRPRGDPRRIQACRIILLDPQVTPRSRREMPIIHGPI